MCQILCSGCDASYFGETSRGLVTRIKEYHGDVRDHRTTSALVDHTDKAGHLPNWKGARVLRCELEKKKRKVLEAMYIATNENINKRTDDIVCVAPATAVCVPRVRGK